jgi:hypothetical protein
MWATVTFFFRAMLYKDVYFVIRGSFLIERFYQNLVWVPSWTAYFQKHILNILQPQPKVWIPFFFNLWKSFIFRCFFLRIPCDKPSSFINLNNHLLGRHLFWTSRLIIPSPHLRPHPHTHSSVYESTPSGRSLLFIMFITLPKETRFIIVQFLQNTFMYSEERHHKHRQST